MKKSVGVDLCVYPPRRATDKIRFEDSFVDDKLILSTFGERVCFLRQQAGFSQEKLAELSNLHRTYISGVERGERKILSTSLITCFL